MSYQIIDVQLLSDASPDENTRFYLAKYVQIEMTINRQYIYFLPYLETINCLSFKICLFIELLHNYDNEIQLMQLEKGFLRKYGHKKCNVK